MMAGGRPIRPLARVGIVGGGQLGRMMIYRARKLGMEVSVLDASEEAPSRVLADRFVQGSLYDRDAIRDLAAGCDVITYEIEHLNTDALAELESEGHTVHPSASVLRTIQDKLVQKRALSEAGVAVPRFEAFESIGEAAEVAQRIHRFGLPCVQKTRTGGYDGRGVLVLDTEADLGTLLEGESMLEEKVRVRNELAVIIARGKGGQMVHYPPVGMRFKPGANLLEWLEAPAELDAATERRVYEQAVRAVDAIGGVGIFAVELFVAEDGRVLVNEIAPRPHNSGHFTIEACTTDQFEQHLRAICGLPLAPVRQLSPAVMINLLGEPGWTGTPVIDGLDEVLAIEGVQFHWYGKSATRGNRKMGHVTVLGSTLDEARKSARQVMAKLRIRGEERDG